LCGEALHVAAQRAGLVRPHEVVGVIGAAFEAEHDRCRGRVGEGERRLAPLLVVAGPVAAVVVERLAA